MGKLINSISIMSGLSLLFYFGGILSGTITSTLLSMALHPESLQTSTLYITIGSVTALVLGLTSITLGRYLNNDLYYMVAFVGLFASFGWDFIKIYTQMSSYSDIGAVLITLIFGPLMIMYVISVVEWWRGVET